MPTSGWFGKPPAKPRNPKSALRVVYLGPPSQAYAVFWHDQLQRTFPTKAEATYYKKDLEGQTAREAVRRPDLSGYHGKAEDYWKSNPRNAGNPPTNWARMFPGDTHKQMVHAVTEYDRQQERKPGHNRYALGLYLQAIDRAEQDMRDGASLRKAITHNFNGRLMDRLLKTVGEPAGSLAEHKGGLFNPRKAAKRKKNAPRRGMKDGPIGAKAALRFIEAAGGTRLPRPGYETKVYEDDAKRVYIANEAGRFRMWTWYDASRGPFPLKVSRY